MSKIFISLRNAIAVGLCCSLLILSACATTAETDQTIETRATERWKTLLSGDLDGAYQFLSPGYRSSVTSLQYQRSVLLSRVKWTGAQYIESDCTETVCKVKISLNYVLYGAVPGIKSYEGTQPIEESWVLVDGNWYFVPDK